jgi:hypothetical protein
LGWTGTADTVISDVVNDWTSTNYSTGNFFITGGGSLSVITAGSQAMTANTFSTLSIAAAAIPANAKNLILFCWTDSTQAQNTTLDWHDVRLTKTDVRVPVETRSLSDEAWNCLLWFYQNINTDGFGGQGNIFLNNSFSGAPVIQSFLHPRPMPSIPTVSKIGTWPASNCGQPVAIFVTRSGFFFSVTATAAGGVQSTNQAAGAGYTVSRDL